MSGEMMGISRISIIMITLLAINWVASGAEGGTSGDITSLWGLIGDPVKAFNALDPSTKTTVQGFLGLLVLALIVCVFFGISKNTMKTAVGSSTKNAKMTTSGISDNLIIGVTLILGIIILGISIGIVTNLGK